VQVDLVDLAYLEELAADCRREHLDVLSSGGVERRNDSNPVPTFGAIALHARYGLSYSSR
jgi:hypothetical protein